MTLHSVQRLREHAHQLARAFDVTLIETSAIKPEDAAAHTGRRVVMVTPITEETGYAIALHEMGHLCDPVAGLHGGNVTMDAELAAWAWAEHYALDWSPAMTSVKEWALGTYAQGEARKRELANRPAPKPSRVSRDVVAFAGKIKWGK